MDGLIPGAVLVPGLMSRWIQMHVARRSME